MSLRIPITEGYVSWLPLTSFTSFLQALQVLSHPQESLIFFYLFSELADYVDRPLKWNKNSMNRNPLVDSCSKLDLS